MINRSHIFLTDLKMLSFFKSLYAVLGFSSKWEFRTPHRTKTLHWLLRNC